MTMLLTEKTKQEKIMNEVQKRRNLFGLGLTSLIAACGATDSATDNTDNTAEVDLDKRPTTDLVPVQLTAMTTLGDDNKANVTSPDPAVVVGRAANKGDLKITILASTEQAPTPATNDFEMIFRNGDHLSDSNADGVEAFVYTELTGKYDLVVWSDDFGNLDSTNKRGALYIIWDIGDGGKFGDVTSSVEGETVPKHLKIFSNDSDIQIGAYAPLVLYKDLGGDADQVDLAFKLSSDRYSIIWDVAKHATTDTDVPETLLEVTTGAIPGILQISTEGELNLGDIVKINNNDGYDMIVKSLNVATYIVWDFAKYYDADPEADPTPVVSLNARGNPTAATHGALAITGEFYKNISIKKATTEPNKGGFTDIDGGGTNDIAFAYDGNTYILFGEKVANIDEESGTAISHTVDLREVAGGGFYDKAGAGREVVTTPATTGGFFDFDLDGDDMTPDVENVGYRFAAAKQGDLTTLADITREYEDAINPPPAEAPTDGALSEETYWDVA